MKSLRMAPLLLLLITLAALVRPLDSAQTQVYPPTDYPLQGGAVQMPLRLCVLHNFAGPKTEPGTPNQMGTMVQGHAPDNFFYSTSPVGGTSNQGTVFSITRNGDVKVLYSFTGKSDGGGPRGGLALGNDGYLYGTTPSGGDYGVGTIFKISRSGGSPEPVYSFRSGKIVPPPGRGEQPTQQQIMDAAGAYPSTAPVQAADGNLYGVTGFAASGGGTIYRISPSGAFKCLYLFKSTDAATVGGFPASLSVGLDGNLYGTTWAGGLKTGTVFQFNPASATLKTIYIFKNTAEEADGSQSWGVILGSDGVLYGTTANGGPSYRGVVFSLTLSGQYKILHAFTGNASNPVSGVVEVPQQGIVSGNFAPQKNYLYGTSALNYSVVSRFINGIIYRISMDGKDYSVVYNFDGTTGAGPAIAPVLGRDFDLYGLASGGGAHQQGVFYSLNTAYSATGEAEAVTDTDTVHQRAVFQGNGLSYIYDNSLVQVVTHMAGFQPAGSSESRALTSDGVTVRAKNPDADIVQFMYREQIVNGKNQAGFAQEVSVPKQNVDNPDYAYDPQKTYSKENVVVYGNQDWMSITNGPNKGNTPKTGSKFWVAVNQLGCSGAVHSCYELTTDPSQPFWVPDAEPPSALYASNDTQVNCDGLTIFDSPGFNEIPGTIQKFTGLDYVIVDGKVVQTVTWKIEKDPSPDPANPLPLKYTQVSFTGPPTPAQLTYYRNLLAKYKFTPAF